MWPQWLAETLDRASLESRLDRGARTQRVLDREPPVESAIDEPLDAADWDEATGFSIHAGYGAERVD